MNRRDFISATCMGCMGIAAGLSILSAESCKTTEHASITFSNGMLNIPNSLFTATEYQVFSNSNLEYNVLLVKQTDGSYRAFEMRCTHKGAALKADSSGIYCPEHGSKFNEDGTVLKGPATTSLQEYKVALVNGVIQVNTII